MLPQVIGQAGRGEQVLDVALMARALADNDFGRAGLSHRDCRADDDRRIGVDCGAGLIFHEVGLEQHSFAGHRHAELAHPAQNDVAHVGCIVCDGGEKHRRYRGTSKAGRVVLPPATGRCGQRSCGERGEEGAPVQPRKRMFHDEQISPTRTGPSRGKQHQTADDS